MKIEFHDLTKQFDQGQIVLQSMNFADDIHSLAIIGPSGGENLPCFAFWGDC